MYGLNNPTCSIMTNCVCVVVLSDDDSRVVLAKIPGVLGSDYINASFITVRTHHSPPSLLNQMQIFQGYNGNNYIATQGILTCIHMCVIF